MTRRIKGEELDRIREDWHKFMPRRVVDPERDQRELDEWDRKREAEEVERRRVWEARRRRWDRFKEGESGAP